MAGPVNHHAKRVPPPLAPPDFTANQANEIIDSRWQEQGHSGDAMLRASHKSLFSRDFVISRAEAQVAEVTSAWFRERAKLRVEGEEFVLCRESLFQGSFSLRRGEGVVARAQKMFWRRAFVVEFEGRSIELMASHFWGREYGVFENGVEIGTIGPTSWFGREYAIELPEDLPRPVQVFLF